MAEQQISTPISLTDKLLAALFLFATGGIIFGYGEQVGGTIGSVWNNFDDAGHFFYEKVYSDDRGAGESNDGLSPAPGTPLGENGTINSPGEVLGQ